MSFSPFLNFLAFSLLFLPLISIPSHSQLILNHTNPLLCSHPASLVDGTSHRRAILTTQKQGILPLWFANKSDYSKISAHDQIETIGLKSLLSGENIGESGIRLRVTKPSGEVVEIETKHTMSPDQVEWLRAGSALNYIGEQARRA
jgi:hypothetical protein